MKKQTHLSIPLSFSLVQPLFCSNSHHCNRHCRPSQQLPAMHAASPLPPPSARSGGSCSGNSSQYRKHLAVAACKSFPPAYAHWQLQHQIKTWSISPPPSPLPRNKGTIINQSLLSSWPLILLSAYAMLLPSTPRCCHHRHHAAAALLNALLLPLKLRFQQAAASIAKLAAAAVLLPLLPLPRCCHCRATTAYKNKI